MTEHGTNENSLLLQSGEYWLDKIIEKHKTSSLSRIRLVFLTGGGWESSLLTKMILESIQLPSIQSALEEYGKPMEVVFMSVDYGHIAFPCEYKAVAQQLEAITSYDLTDGVSKKFCNVNIELVTHKTKFFELQNPENFLMTGNPEHPAELSGRNYLFIYLSLIYCPSIIVLGAEPVEYDGFYDCSLPFFNVVSEEMSMHISTPLLYMGSDFYKDVVDQLDPKYMEYFFSCYNPVDIETSRGCGKCKHCDKSNKLREKFNLGTKSLLI